MLGFNNLIRIIKKGVPYKGGNTLSPNVIRPIGGTLDRVPGSTISNSGIPTKPAYISSVKNLKGSSNSSFIKEDSVFISSPAEVQETVKKVKTVSNEDKLELITKSSLSRARLEIVIKYTLLNKLKAAGYGDSDRLQLLSILEDIGQHSQLLRNYLGSGVAHMNEEQLNLFVRLVYELADDPVTAAEFIEKSFCHTGAKSGQIVPLNEAMVDLTLKVHFKKMGMKTVRAKHFFENEQYREYIMIENASVPIGRRC
jgi:hypothetical protein